MQLNDLLTLQGIDPRHVLVLRHRPQEPALNRVLPWLAAEKPDIFNAYQQTQGARLEQSMAGAEYVASFIGRSAGTAHFVGLYKVGSSRPLTREQYWQVPAYVEMKTYGMRGFADQETRDEILWFDLALTSFYSLWQGKLIVSWPPPERSWWRRAHRNEMPIVAILQESAFVSGMPPWDQLCLMWEELQVLPTPWRTAMSHWRAIYYILDVSDGKAYVGSAYGAENLLGRWIQYAARGHGGNVLLRERKPEHLRFSILQRLSPDMDTSDVIRLEATWKERLRTRAPHGLNEN